MEMALSYYSKEQENSFINRNKSAAIFGRSLMSGSPVSSGEPEIRSTTHLEKVEGKKIGLVTNHLFTNLHVNSFFLLR
jgi:hypothetical protein